MQEKKQSLVPELRFPGFEGEWEVKTLGEIANKCNSRNKDKIETRVFTNSATEGVVDQNAYFDKDIAVKENTDNYHIVDKDDFVYNPRISSSAPVGPISRNKIGRGIMSPLYTVFRFKSENIDYLEFFFQTNIWHKYLKQVANYGARFDRMAINTEDFYSMPIFVPSLPEQQKIAECLSSVDDRIQAEADKLQALKEHKKGLMQQLFPQEGETTPKLRFPGFDGEWEEKKLGEVADSIVVGFPFKSEDLTNDNAGVLILRGLSIGEGYIKHGGEYDKYYTGETNSLKKYILHRDDIVMGMDGSIGRNIAIVTKKEDNSLLIQRVARIRISKYPLHLIYQQIISQRFKDYVCSEKVGAVIAHISQKQIENFPILVAPQKAEQQKIADCLSSLDEEIVAQQQKVEALKEHKKGLMQKLFPTIN